MTEATTPAGYIAVQAKALELEVRDLREICTEQHFDRVAWNLRVAQMVLHHASWALREGDDGHAPTSCP